jgi:CMP-N-acetylneuraminic acid synthetase
MEKKRMSIPPVKALIFMKHHSERVPRKNMRPICGRPLFHWIMDALSQSEYITEIIIDTDSEEISQSARKNFNVTIHMRPEYLLNITGNEANQIMAYDLTQTDGEYFLQTHSTNPLLTTKTIDHAIDVFFQGEGHDSLFTVTPLQKRFYWANGNPVNHDPHNMIKTQLLPVIYEENSCIYIFSRVVFEKYNDRIGRNPKLLPIDRFEAIDIDEEDDFLLAQYFMNQRLERENKNA